MSVSHEDEHEDTVHVTARYPQLLNLVLSKFYMYNVFAFHTVDQSSMFRQHPFNLSLHITIILMSSP